MATIWKSTDQKHSNHETNAISRQILASWSRQQKLAMIAGFAILGLLLVISACSKQSPKPALVGVSSPTPVSKQATQPATPAAASSVAPTTAAKKTPKTKRPANVSYKNSDAGVSFLYPRRFTLTSGDKAQPELGAMGDVPMNFIQPGGVTVATVAAPSGSYPGTDFSSAFFSVNVNRSVSEEQCEHFAFVDTRNADDEPVKAEKVRVGASQMETTSSFSASMLKQAEAQYYHSYENGACYEYVLGLGTTGYGAKDGIEHVDRDEIFAKLEQILATVKINPVVQEHAAEQTEPTMASGHE